MLQWAIERSDIPMDQLRNRFNKLQDWIEGSRQPTFKQLEAFAKATYTPIGYLFLSAPPHEEVPIPDFRTIAGKPIGKPSANLLDTIYLCQQRQEWFHDYAISTGLPPLASIGSAKITDSVVATAGRISQALGFDLQERSQFRTWTEALKSFIDRADALGILVMTSGVVGSNNSRSLDPEEFRGFALADSFAPLVFINGADSKSAQMFTLAHEISHLWLGESALSDTTMRSTVNHRIERWCNAVAAEILVPIEAIQEQAGKSESIQDEMNRLARYFKVSTLVILRRLHDAGYFSREEYWALYDSELRLLRMKAEAQTGGGDFYRTTLARVSQRFTRAVVTSAMESRASFTEAFRLLGCSKMSTFEQLGQSAGVGI